MTQKQQCCCSTESNIMILACSGGSNVGQLTNQVAVELTKEGWGKMFCLAGIGAHLGGFVQSAKDTPVVIILDGCEIGCGKEIFRHLNIPVNYSALTDGASEGVWQVNPALIPPGGFTPPSTPIPTKSRDSEIPLLNL